MTTLREECAKRGLKVQRREPWSPFIWVYDCYDAMVHALGPYGDYEVVEVEIGGTVRDSDKQAWKTTLITRGEHSLFGAARGRTKLLVPPREGAFVGQREDCKASGKESYHNDPRDQQDDTEAEAVSLAVQAYVRTMMRERDERIAEVEEALEACQLIARAGPSYEVTPSRFRRIRQTAGRALRKEAAPDE